VGNREWSNSGGRVLNNVGEIVLSDDEVRELGDPGVIVDGVRRVVQVVEVGVEIRGPEKEWRHGGSAVAKEECKDFAWPVRRWERLADGWYHAVVLREGEYDGLEVAPKERNQRLFVDLVA
jgi:hypothetical protein